jgi:hypothetical protein
MSAISLSSLPPQTLSTIPTSPAGPTDPATTFQRYFKERRADVQVLNEALKAGDLSAAQQAYNNIVALGKNDLHKDNPYLRSDRGLDFNAIGGALANGDLNGAQQAFAALQSTYGHGAPPPSGTPTPLPATVVNLSSAPSASLSVPNPASTSAPAVSSTSTGPTAALNLGNGPRASAQEIIAELSSLNLAEAGSGDGNGSKNPASGVNVIA